MDTSRRTLVTSSLLVTSVHLLVTSVQLVSLARVTSRLLVTSVPLLVTSVRLLVARIHLLVTRVPLLVTRVHLLVACVCLLVACVHLLVTRVPLLVTRVHVLVTRFPPASDVHKCDLILGNLPFWHMQDFWKTQLKISAFFLKLIFFHIWIKPLLNLIYNIDDYVRPCSDFTCVGYQLTWVICSGDEMVKPKS